MTSKGTGRKVRGKIIAAFGLPGSGKSSVTREIGKALNLKTFLEPEENNWGDAVKCRGISGNFAAIMWFRATRIPMLYKAKHLKEDGQTVILDSFYDKLICHYIGSHGIDWLINNRDPYYEDMVSIAKKDYDLLPDIDCLIFFRLDITTWLKFINRRNRNMDNEIGFRKGFVSQSHFLKAAKLYCTDKNCQLIICNQRYSTPKIIAREVISELKAKKIIL